MAEPPPPSGVAVLAPADSPAPTDEPVADGGGGLPDIVRRRLTTVASDPGSWVPTLLVVFVAALMRALGLRNPPQIIFDETYYAYEARGLLQHGVEWQFDNDSPRYVVHPPLGKWLIAIGEQIYGYNSLGWRISALVAGTLSILLIVRIGRRLFRSTILGCAAGLLVTFDGLHFVLSRTALLDIFLTLFVVATFGCLLLDRDQRRNTALRALDAGRPVLFGFPWWRIAAGLSLGCASSVKQSGAFFLPAVLLIILSWEVGLQRSIGTPRAWAAALRTTWPSVAALVGVALAAYLASWTGWFLSDDGYNRHMLRNSGKDEPPIWGALYNLWDYHRQAFTFHIGLHSGHPYQSWPWQWMLDGRPVLFYRETNQPCGANSCVADVTLLGTPLLWWSFMPALAGLAYFGIQLRDRRAAAIGLMVALGLLPWFWYHYDGGRTMFVFYALPAEPFLVFAVVYVLGVFMKPPNTRRIRIVPSRLRGALILGGYVLLIAACFAWFYPVYTGESLPYADWWARMWLGNRWV